jgi:carbonic anhydrase
MRIRYRHAAAAVLAAAAPLAAGAQPDPIDVAAEGTWSYAGPTGPDFWATTLPHRECAPAPRQSPVDLPRVALSAPLNVRVSYPRDGDAWLVNTGHTVNLYLRDRAALEVADSAFAFVEIHFHVPAEHMVQGRRYAGEIHAVHQQGTVGNRAVLTTLIAEGSHNDTWNSLVNGLPGNRGDSTEIGIIDLVAMLAVENLASEQLYSYAGSLTTPPCQANVRFLIRERTLTLSRQQIDALASAFARNVRPVFPVSPTAVTLHRVVP